jgi:EmrB/QacA subfamily drug resistance transporter
LLLGLSLAALDVLVVSPALPSVVADLGGLPLYPWVFSAYLLAITVTAPIFGRLADAYGRRPFYLLGLALFVSGSALCGAAHGMGFLVAMRVVQGLGASAVVSLTLTLVGDLYPLEDRARMQGVFSSVWGIASVVGPPVGGFLVTHLGWRSVFYLNVPFGVAAALLILRHLREPARGGRRHEFDVAGAGALACGLTALLLALQQLGGGREWNEGGPLALSALGLVLLAAFGARERRAREPLVDPELLRSRLFLAANAGGFLGFAALYSATAYVPLLVRGVRGGTAQDAGLALMPLSLAWVVASVVAGRLMLRAGYRVTTGLGTVLIALGCAGLSGMGPGAAELHLRGTLAVLGAGMGLAMTGFIVAVQGAAPPGRMGIASSAVQFFRSLGGAVGVAVLGAVLLGALRLQGIGELALVVREGAGPGPLEALPATGLMAALHAVFRTGLAFALASVVAGLAMPGGTPGEHLHAGPGRAEPGSHGPADA